MPIGSFDQGAGDRGLSTKLWHGLNPDVIRNDPRRGMFYLDDFLQASDLTADAYVNGRQYVEATGRVVLADDEEFGVEAIGGAAATDNQAQAVFWPGCVVTPAAGRTIVMEARVKVDTITTGSDAFVGLGQATIDVSHLTAGAIAASMDNVVGFWSIRDLALLAGGIKADVSATTAATGFVDGAYTKIGLRINGLKTLQFFQDGTEITNTIADTSIPIVALRPGISNGSDGTDAALLSIDWMAIGAT